MMKRVISLIKENPIVYWFFLTLIGFLFLLQAFGYAHQLPSRVDEGSFLIKGYYYATGKYLPFEDYGPWTNNMPLAYYFPGIAQAFFGPGLRTGRYFAIFISVLMLIGIWMLMNRLKGKWWALAGMLFVALNAALISMLVQAVSQVLVACLLAWALFFLIGEERNQTQIALGALLCTLATLTRQNMILLIPFVIWFAFDLNGRRAGWIALLFSIVPLILVHVIFFPDIMKLWYPWMPGLFTRALGVTVVEGGGTQAWLPEVDLITRVLSFFMTMRYHFVPLLGVFSALLVLPDKKKWDSDREWKYGFFLTLLFLAFFILHAWASLTKNYCVFCFSIYLVFFIPIALIVTIIIFSNIIRYKPNLSSLPVTLFTLCVIPGLFYGSQETIGRWVMALPAPRIREGQLLSGATQLWKIFENRYNLTYEQLILVLPTIFGFFVAVFFILISFLIYRGFKLRPAVKYGWFLLIMLTLFAILFTPTDLVGKPMIENTCGGDVIQAYEKVGSRLAEAVPANSKVYWGGGSVVTPLLYITDAQIHPPQLNGIYSARRGGDRDLLEKSGYYNEESRHAWMTKDEFFLIGNANVVDFWQEFLDSDLFDEYDSTPPLDPCDPDSFIRIYHRK